MRFLSSFITFLGLWVLTLPAFCQWTDISSSRLDIKFKDQNTGWMTGEGGMLQKTTDGGKTWFNVQTPVEYEGQDITQLFLFGDVMHVVSTNAYPVMQRFSTMYSSTDGGVTWVNDVNSNNERIGGHFATAMLGWYWDRSEYDYANLAYRTIDGGRNWVEDSDLKEVVAMFTLNNTTWALLTKDAKYQLWKSTDGGVSWTTKNEITPYIDNYNAFTSLQFLDDQNGWLATTYQDQFYKTSDGGVTWQFVKYDNTLIHDFVKKVHFINANNGLIITNDGHWDVIFKTTNGGTTWNRVLTTPDPYTVTFEKIYFRDALNGFLLGTSGYTAMTADGGNTWTQTNYCSASTNFEIEGLAYNGQDIWAVGRGILQRSSNGTEWQVDPLGLYSVDNEFLRIAFPRAKDGKGVFIGELPYASTINNGDTWTFTSPQFDYNSDYYHEEVRYDPAGNIWIANINGPLYKSTDGGLTYKLKYDPPGYATFANVAFQSEKNVWYYGPSLLRSKDGGNTWTQTSETINAMFFLNNYVGWKIRGDGSVFKTIDGAESWQSVSTVSQWPGFEFIHFADEFTGWIADRYTNVLKTTDGGKTWIKEVVGVYGVTNDAVFTVNEQNKVVGYVGGNRLIRFNSGYTPVPFLNVNAPLPTATTNDLKVLLQWPDNSTGEDGFIIQVLSGGNWVEQTRTPSNQYETTVAAYGNYTFRVGAYKQGRVVAMGEPLIVAVTDPSNLAPVLVTMSPLVSATNVDPASTLKLEFNKNIEVVLPADIQINYSNSLGSGTKVISLSASTFSISGKVFTVTPPEPLPYASSITVIVKSTTIKDNQGHFFAGVNDWSFSTKGDTKPPAVVTLFPADGAIDVDTKTQLKITFDEPIAFQPGKMRVLYSNGGNPTDVDLTAQNTTVQNNTVTITPHPELIPGAAVSIAFPEGIFADVAGNKFQLVPYLWAFSTKANITAVEKELISQSIHVSQAGDEIIIQNSTQHFKVEGIFDILGRSIPFTSNNDQVSFRKQQGIILIRYYVNGNFRTEKMLFSK